MGATARNKARSVRSKADQRRAHENADLLAEIEALRASRPAPLDARALSGGQAAIDLPSAQSQDLGAARGVLTAIVLGAALWSGILYAVRALIS